MEMVYPRRIDWSGRPTGHPALPAVRAQRDLVAASLLEVPVLRLRWDERTRCQYPTR
jgi:hypothetical protein